MRRSPDPRNRTDVAAQAARPLQLLEAVAPESELMGVEGLGVDPERPEAPAQAAPFPRRVHGAHERRASDWAGIGRALYPLLKRALDIVLAIGLFIVATPLLCLAGLLIVRGDGGPVLYWQRRVGKNGVEFWLPKLRSMHVDADRVTVKGPARDTRPGAPPKLEEDPRVTPVGQWLRRWSIDELPQLWCVLKGEMSMVGPRPSLPEEVACYGEVERRRLAVQPGITCIWQVSGRSDLPFASQIALDLRYIDNRGLALDLRLILMTIKAVLTRRGAY